MDPFWLISERHLTLAEAILHRKTQSYALTSTVPTFYPSVWWGWAFWPQYRFIFIFKFSDKKQNFEKSDGSRICHDTFCLLFAFCFNPRPHTAYFITRTHGGGWCNPQIFAKSAIFQLCASIFQKTINLNDVRFSPACSPFNSVQSFCIVNVSS